MTEEGGTPTLHPLGDSFIIYHIRKSYAKINIMDFCYGVACFIGGISKGGWDVMKLIEKVMTTAEAAELWNIPVVTIKQACSGQRGYPPRFTSEECRKSGHIWLVTRAGMERVYGKI